MTEVELLENFQSPSEDEMFVQLSTVASGLFKWRKRTSSCFSAELSKVKFRMDSKKLKRCVIECSSSKNCEFRVNINFDSTKMLYFFNVIHPIHTDHEVKALGKVKKYVQQLSAEELTFITPLGVAQTSLSAAMVVIHRAFLVILFSKVLIKREMKKVKQKKSNSENTNLVKLINCGQKCIIKGVSFNLHFNNGSILTGVTFQEALQLKLSEPYGDSIKLTPHMDLQDIVWLLFSL
eukprot:snap_masked-scaffold_28-processed-gene-4.66-mRNA-1 protein AED:1.00 eAED:1.00 QI:0/-1/0/0/-1/1/1/0/235